MEFTVEYDFASSYKVHDFELPLNILYHTIPFNEIVIPENAIARPVAFIFFYLFIGWCIIGVALLALQLKWNVFRINKEREDGEV